MERFTWAELANITGHMVQRTAMAGERRGFIMSVFRTLSVQIIVRMFLSTVASGTFAVNRHSTDQGRSVHMLQFYEDIIQHFEKNPSTSTHVVGHAVGVNHRLVWNVVHEQHQQNVLGLVGHNDYFRKDQFVHWFVHQSTQKSSFPVMVWFMDEACFTREGIFNNQNGHVWAEANPHAASAHCHQKCFVVVWAGIVNDFLMWP
jgi:hypothetical protein